MINYRDSVAKQANQTIKQSIEGQKRIDRIDIMKLTKNVSMPIQSLQGFSGRIFIWIRKFGGGGGSTAIFLISRHVTVIMRIEKPGFQK